MFASQLASVFVSLVAQADPVAMCAGKILPYEGWTQTPTTEWSFVADPAAGGGTLSYFGAQHSREPAHPQFEKMAHDFADARPSVIFYEGPDRGVGVDAAETITTRGEAGYIRLLATNAGASIQSLEPSPMAHANALIPGFGAERVLMFFVLREVAQLRDRDGLKGAALDQAAARMLAGAAALMEAAGTPAPFRDLAGLEAAYATQWADGSDWRAAPSRWSDPLADDAVTGGRFMSAISRASNEFRDRHMYGLLARAVLSGERVFAVVGRNHVPMQAEALKCALAAPA